MIALILTSIYVDRSVETVVLHRGTGSVRKFDLLTNGQLTRMLYCFSSVYNRCNFQLQKNICWAAQAGKQLSCLVRNCVNVWLSYVFGWGRFNVCLLAFFFFFKSVKGGIITSEKSASESLGDSLWEILDNSHAPNQPELGSATVLSITNLAILWNVNNVLCLCCIGSLSPCWCPVPSPPFHPKR